MCLIIQREPNFEIPYDKFESAILNNPDGYGFSYPDNNGKLITLRSAEEPDPETLYRIVNEELKDKQLMVHLRYTTAGATNLRNSHPFPILERGPDGIDLRMCHNGTLFKYKPKKGDESDTRVFVREFVRPLFKRLARGMDPEELLNDPFTKKLLEDQLSTSSVLTFLDGDGNTLICNETGNGGKKEDGWYYSNTYSFDPSHRVTPVTKTTPNTRTTGSGTGTVATPLKSSSGISYSDTSCIKFTSLFSLDSIEDVFHFTDSTLDAVIDEPNATRALIKELIAELYDSTKQVKRLKGKK